MVIAGINSLDFYGAGNWVIECDTQLDEGVIERKTRQISHVNVV